MTMPPRPELPRPRKRFGQHFLRDPGALDAIANALGDVRGRSVVEIGPGRGALTDRLVERGARLTLIEIDRDLASFLEERYRGVPDVRIICGDVLEQPLGEIAGEPWSLVGNVPYYITTPIIFHALRNPRPEVAVYLVQKEVAGRLSAVPGQREYGALTANVSAFASVQLLLEVSRTAFMPPPRVESAVVRLRPLAEPVIASELEASYRRFVQHAFGLRRKQLSRVVRTITGLDAASAQELILSCDLDPSARPETLGSDDFSRLVTALAAAIPDAATAD